MKPKVLLLVAAIWLGENCASAQPWTQTMAPYACWFSVTSSVDGSNLVATAFYAYNGANGAIYTSTNSGTSWISNNAPSTHWAYAASSADGAKLVAINDNGMIYISTNSGSIWTLATNLPVLEQTGTSIVSSADGNRLIVAYPEGVFRSLDSGRTWISNSVTANNLNWLFLASSADASKVAAADNVGYIYTSTNSGTTWTQTLAPLGNWQCIASSADGNKLVAVAQGSTIGSAGPIYSSTNSGLTWTSNTVPNQPWTSVSSSADGSVLVAVANNGYDNGSPIYISTNSGTSWTPDAVSNFWGFVASSADGTKLVAITGIYGVDHRTKSFITDYIYTSQIKLSPLMNITQANGNLAISWVVPSTNYVMQQSSDLISWSNVANPPVLNLINLQNQIILSASNSGGFYRLATP